MCPVAVPLFKKICIEIAVNPLKPEIHLNDILKFRSYLSENTAVHFKDKRVNAV
jgi:hypothetical protein